MKHKKRAQNQHTYEPGKLRDALVAEGRRLFEEVGAVELSLRAIARGVGVSEAAPSRHFRGKEDLLAAISSSGFRELAGIRNKITVQRLEPRARAREMMMSYVRFALDHAGLFALMIGPRVKPEYRKGELNEISNRSFKYFADSIIEFATAAGWPKKRLGQLAYAAWSTEHGIATLILSQMVPRQEFPTRTEDLVTFTIDFFLDSVGRGPADGR